jgi:2-polyprenyl-6-methoxyphenol hydroxylase-like FAD-dependent oxidoreductase
MQQLSQDSRIAIVGGGIGGLTLAKALQQKGWNCVTVFEQWQALKSRGGSISVMPGLLGGCEPVLESLGLRDKVAAVGRPTSSIESSYNGQVVTKMQYSLGIRVMREALQRILFESLAPGTVRMGTSIRGFHEYDNCVELEFDNDAVEKFDLVVAADGITSKMAENIFPNTGKQFAGTVIYSCLARGEFLPCDFYEHHVNCGHHGFTIRAFAGSGFDGRWDTVNFCVRSDIPVSSNWDAEGTKDNIKPLLDAMQRYGGGCPDWISQLVDASERVMRWGIYETGLKPSWTSSVGKIVLLGDAAHAMAPFLGMGAQSAMLDAHVLASELGQHEHLVDALIAYQAQRKGSCEQLMSKAKFEGLAITSFGAAAAYRNATRQFVQSVHRRFLHSSREYLRLVGMLLLRAHEFGHHAFEMLNGLQDSSTASITKQPDKQ